jgi:hypothetical protein
MTRTQLLAHAETLEPRDGARPVPALPAWTVKDAYAHLAGVCADVLEGHLDGAGTPPWTARHVAARAGDDLPAVVAEWAARGPALDAWFDTNDDAATRRFVFDVWSHEQDIRGATDRRGERDDARVRSLVASALDGFDHRFRQEGISGLRVVTPSVERVLGGGDVIASLRTDEYEAMRMLFGRRSRAQIEAAAWDGDPEPFIDHLHLFDLPERALID